MTEWLPEGLKGWVGVIVAAIAGRMMAHAVAVQAGQRRFFGPHLFWEIPIAIGMGYIAAGTGEWLGLSGNPQLGLVAAASYLGPNGVEALMSRLLAGRRP